MLYVDSLSLQIRDKLVPGTIEAKLFTEIQPETHFQLHPPLSDGWKYCVCEFITDVMGKNSEWDARKGRDCWDIFKTHVPGFKGLLMLLFFSFLWLVVSTGHKTMKILNCIEEYTERHFQGREQNKQSFLIYRATWTIQDGTDQTWNTERKSFLFNSCAWVGVLALIIKRQVFSNL